MLARTLAIYARRGRDARDGRHRGCGTPAPTGPTKIVWWHAMSGSNGEAINKLTADA